MSATTEAPLGNPHSSPVLEPNREVALAIQGGGVFFLSLLGQAKAIVAADYVPLAYAGTSAGAILATLLWSGLGPDEIEQELLDMVSADPAALLNLLSPFEPPPDPHFDFAAFLALRDRIASLLDRVRDINRARWFGGRWRRTAGAAQEALALWRQIEPHFARRGLFLGATLEATVERLIRRGLGSQVGFPPVGEPIRFRHVAEAAVITG